MVSLHTECLVGEFFMGSIYQVPSDYSLSSFPQKQKQPIKMKSAVGLPALLFFSGAIILYLNRKRDDPPGHLKPFGFHAPPVEVDAISVVPDPIEFFEKYVKTSTPVVMKGAAEKFENFKTWKDDDYLREKFGKWLINVDEGKYEGSVFGKSVPMNLKRFLKYYKKREYYLINAIAPDNPMTNEILLLKSMACGGYIEHIDRVLLLFSSGATKSAMHFDDVENIHCVLDGTKEWMLYDSKLREKLPIMENHPAYVAIDCRSVDMHKYPIIQDLPWHRAFLNTGDCLFLPRGWAHHVKSEGNERNMALAVWFGPMLHVNKTDCPDNLDELPDSTPLGSKRMSKLQKAKIQLYSLFEDEVLPKDLLLDSLAEINVTETDAEAFSNKLDSDNNGVITHEEIEAVRIEDIPKVQLLNEEEDVYLEDDDEDSSFYKKRNEL